MPEYFSCRGGCNACCPTPDNKMFAYATIGDVFRAFAFDNPGGDSFSHVASELFDLYVCPPHDGIKESHTVPPELEELVKGGLNITFLSRSDPHVYTLAFGAKLPCANAEPGGCRAHGKPIKYIVCSSEPEEGIALGYDGLSRIMANFPCLGPGIELSDEQATRARTMRAIYEREIEITESFMPRVRLHEVIKEGDAAAARLADLTEGGFADRMTERCMKIIRAFDDEANRTWQAEILALSVEYDYVLRSSVVEV